MKKKQAARLATKGPKTAASKAQQKPSPNFKSCIQVCGVVCGVRGRVAMRALPPCLPKTFCWHSITATANAVVEGQWWKTMWWWWRWWWCENCDGERWWCVRVQVKLWCGAPLSLPLPQREGRRSLQVSVVVSAEKQTNQNKACTCECVFFCWPMPRQPLL